MKKQIPTTVGILIILILAGVVGASVFFLSQEDEEVALGEDIEHGKERVGIDEEEKEAELKGEAEKSEKVDTYDELDPVEQEIYIQRRQEEMKIEGFLARLSSFNNASIKCFGRGRFALEPSQEEDEALEQEIDYIGEYFGEIDRDIENFDYEEMKIAQKKIEDFYEFLIEFYPEDADCMNNHDDGREYDESDFFEI